MIVQVSSGNGPRECSLGAELFVESLKTEYSDMLIVDIGHNNRSMLLYFEKSEPDILGTIQWICKSPYRPNHKRKNWFIDVSRLEEVNKEEINEKDISITTIHSSGPGGQNVNKVETGVRLVYKDISIVCTTQRSQYANKKEALAKLYTILAKRKEEELAKFDKAAWSKHYQIKRGDPIRVYEGISFKRVK